MSKTGQSSAPASSGEDASAHGPLPAGVLSDAEGLIPAFPPRAVDEHGRLIPLSADDRKARTEAILRTDGITRLAGRRSTRHAGAPDAWTRREPPARSQALRRDELSRGAAHPAGRGTAGPGVWPAGASLVDHCHAWLLALEVAGAEVILPAIADYEVRRELLRLNASAKLRNLDVLRARLHYLEIRAAALDRAAAFWAPMPALADPRLALMTWTLTRSSPAWQPAPASRGIP